jgi:hypothetical protein
MRLIIVTRAPAVVRQAHQNQPPLRTNKGRLSMARRVFFSFHYQNDIWRVNQVRNSGEFGDVTGTDTFYDNSLWEEAKKKGDAALRALVEDGLKNSSVTTVLAGSETWSRKWVRYELVKSFERGNGLMTLWIDQVKDSNGKTSTRGKDPLANLFFSMSTDGKTASTLYHDGKEWVAFETISAANLTKAARDATKGLLSQFASSHAWTSGNAAEFAKWAETAAKAAGR